MASHHSVFIWSIPPAICLHKRSRYADATQSEATVVLRRCDQNWLRMILLSTAVVRSNHKVNSGLFFTAKETNIYDLPTIR